MTILLTVVLSLVATSSQAAPVATTWETVAQVDTVKGLACRDTEDQITFKHNARHASETSKSTWLYQSDAIAPGWEEFPAYSTTGWVKGGKQVKSEGYFVPEGVNRHIKIVVKIKGGDKSVGTRHVDELTLC